MTVIRASRYIRAGVEVGVQLQAILDDLDPTTGTTLLFDRPGVYDLEGNVTFADHANIVGMAGGNSATKGVVFRCVAPAAGFTFDDPASAWSRGGRSGGFLIDGNDVATAPPLVIDRAVQRTFSDIHVKDVDGDGMLVKRAQNNLFMAVDIETCADHALVVDAGAGGNQWHRSEFSSVGSYHLLIQETSGGTGPYIYPTHNVWNHCIFERGLAGPTSFEGCVHHSAGIENVFRDCVMSSAVWGHTVALIRLSGGEMTLDQSYLQGSAQNTGGDGIYQTGGGLFLTGRSRFVNLTTGWVYDAGYGSMNSSATYASVGARWGGSGTTRPNASFARPLQTSVESTSPFGLRVSRHDESGMRWQADASGLLGWADGTTFTPQQTLGIDAGKFRFTGGAVTGVATDAASIHAALVTLGLITA